MSPFRIYTTTLFLCSVQSLIHADTVTPHITLLFFRTFYTTPFGILLSTSSIALIAHQTFGKSIRLSLCSKQELIFWPYRSYRHLDILIRTLVSYPTRIYVEIIDRQSSAHIHNSLRVQVVNAASATKRHSDLSRLGVSSQE